MRRSVRSVLRQDHFGRFLERQRTVSSLLLNKPVKCRATFQRVTQLPDEAALHTQFALAPLSILRRVTVPCTRAPPRPERPPFECWSPLPFAANNKARAID